MNLKTIYLKLKEKWIRHFNEALSMKTTPEAIAWGFSIGTFIGVIPTPGISVIIGLAITLIFKKISKYALFGAFLFWNVLTLSPLYYLSYRIGDWLYGYVPSGEIELNILQQAYHFTGRFLVGNVIVAALTAVVSFFAALIIARAYQKRKLMKELKEIKEEDKNRF